MRDREQLMLRHTIELNEQRTALEQREQKLREREMQLIEMEFRLLMAKTNQDFSHPQTPRIHKRSGKFMRSLLTATLLGHSTICSATANNLISPPMSKDLF